MTRRIVALLLCFVLAVLLMVSAVSAEEAKEESKVVRVGWYETPFNHKDQFGRRTGYAYVYQRKIAAYTGWKYEYVEGTWSELLQMLQDGRIDLLSDVSYTEERTEYMFYSHIPMGSELYYLYVSPENTTISIEDPTTLNGKKIGVTRGTIQREFFREWSESHGVTQELIELDTGESESLAMLDRGELDAFLTLDTYGDPDKAIPLWKIGASDFYFVVAKNRPDLQTELDAALSHIQDENKFYSNELSQKYLVDSGTLQYLTAEEKEWLEGHGKIRVAYQDNYLAFCAADPKTGELTGALKDYLEFASGVLENARPEFEAVAYPTATAALEAVKNGEADCMFPANLTDYDAETAGVIITAPLMTTEMDAVVREEDQQDFLRKSQVRVGVNQGNPNYEMFLLEHFPNWTPVYYESTPACLNAMASKGCDTVIISNYRFSDIARQCSRLHLTTVYTGVDMDYSLAVKEGNSTLYSILSKVISQVSDAAVNAALTYYSSNKAQNSFLDYIVDHPSIAILDALCLALIITVVVLTVRMKKSKKKPG